VLLVFVAAGAVLVGGLVHVTGVLRTQEAQTIDTRFSIRGTQRPPSNLLLVAVNDVTFSQFSSQGVADQWPFPRRYHARVINTLHRDGARLIAVDMQFTEQTDPTDDNDLVQAVANAPGTVLVTTEVAAHGQTNIFGGNSVLAQIGAVPANAAVVPDPGGEIRRDPLQIQGLDTMAWAIAKRAQPGLRPPSQTPTWIDYAGPPMTIPTVAYSQVYNGQVPASLIRGKIVIIGATAPSLQDVHATPTSGGGVMAGPEIQANAVSTFLRGGPLRSTGLAADLVLIVLLGAAAPLCSLGLRRARLARALPIALGALYILGVQLLFDDGWIIPLIAPLLALAVGLVGTLGVDYMSASFEHERVFDLFSRFVPDAVVKEVVQEADGVRLGGVQRMCTVMFCDLRGFTSFSSAHEPQRVIDVVNSYLGEMSDAILDAGGTLVAYMGDGIFAVFGAPIEQLDHADRALAAALEMLTERLPRFNERLRTMGLEAEFRMGIGLNSGMVISGNVGSERRLEYAAIGDTTNLAARIEATTKDTPHMLLFSDATRESFTRPPDDPVFVRELELRGANRSVKLWTVDGTQGTHGEHTQASVLSSPALEEREDGDGAETQAR
jgi:adenylate cyclase